MRESVEDFLRAIRTQAALLRYLTQASMTADAPPDGDVLDAMTDICADIEDRAEAIGKSLAFEGLETFIRVERR